MNLKKMWKRFWNLNVHNHEGFTLVELIIVIAILAILSSVAVVGYSSYIEKANKQADMTLVAEIENALTLAMYDTPFEEEPTGVLILSTTGITLNGNSIDPTSEIYTVLTKAFGSLDNLKLKYNGWKIASHVNGMTSDEATLVNGSSYLSGDRADMLLSDVEKFTAMATNLSQAITGTPLAGDMTLASLYGQKLLDDTAAKYNIVVDDQYKAGGNVDWDAWGHDHPQEFSNMLVLATALDNQNYMNELENGNYGAQMSASTSLIKDFSSYYAFAATCPAFSKVLTQYMDVMNADAPTMINGVEVKPVTDPASGAAWYRQLEAEVSKYTNKDNLTYAKYTEKNAVGDSQASDDQIAFMTIMSALSNASAEDIAGNLGNANLFTEGAVKDVYDQYMDAVVSMAGSAGLSINATEGIAIIYNQGDYRVVNTAN